jgi:hypothetical protein
MTVNPINTYSKNAKIRISGSFTDPNNSDAAIDPTNVTISYRIPGASALTSKVYPTDAEVVRESQGNYHLDLTGSTSGKYTYTVEGTGNAVGAGQGEFIVLEGI